MFVVDEFSNNGRAGRSDGPALDLLGGFALRTPSGERVLLPANCQRLLALMAISRVSSRPWLYGTLWPNTRDPQAQASLRTAVWQINRRIPGLLTMNGPQLSLPDLLEIDLHQVRSDVLAMSIEAAPDVSPMGVHRIRDAAELLPGWYDDWVLLARESFRNLRLDALERSSEQFLKNGRPGDALQLALAAVADEPLRDSAHRLVLLAHLAHGNAGEAVRHFGHYTQLLATELGLAPSAQMHRIIQSAYSPEH